MERSSVLIAKMKVEEGKKIRCGKLSSGDRFPLHASQDNPWNTIMEFTSTLIANNEQLWFCGGSGRRLSRQETNSSCQALKNSADEFTYASYFLFSYF